MNDAANTNDRDTAIIARFEERDETVLADVERQYGRAVTSVCRNILGNDADAQEVANDTYLKLWESIPPAKPQSFLGYLLTIARHAAFDRYRHDSAKCRSSQIVALSAEMEECIPERPTTDEKLGEMISTFLRQLDATPRFVFVRRYWYADGIETIAATCSMPVGTVKSMLSRTRIKLRRYLESEGVTL